MSAIKISHVVLILPDRVVLFARASGKLVTVVRTAQTTPVEALATLLATHPVKRGQRLLVAASDFFTQIVRLPVMQTHGLKAADLGNALAFEVEPFSTLTQATGVLAYAKGEVNASMQAWHVLQLARAEIDAMRKVARAQRLFVAAFATPLVAMTEADNAALPVILNEWLSRVCAVDAPFPLLDVRRMARRGLDMRKTAAVLFTAVFALAAVLHFWMTRAELLQLREESRRLSASTAANAQIVNANRQLQAQLDQHEKSLAEKASKARTVARYRTSWHLLLTGLRSAAGEDVLLRRISGSEPFEATIEAVSSSDTAPGTFLERLQEALSDSGWRIHGEKQQRSTSTVGPAIVTFHFFVTLDLPRPSVAITSDIYE